jgi:hypothetical protein
VEELSGRREQEIPFATPDFPGNGYFTYTSQTQNYEVDKWLADYLASGVSELNKIDIPF